MNTRRLGNCEGIKDNSKLFFNNETELSITKSYIKPIKKGILHKEQQLVDYLQQIKEDGG